MRNQRGFSSLLSILQTNSGLPYVLALVAPFLASTHCSAATAPWRICEVYSNADGSSQFIQFCGLSEEQTGAERAILGKTLIATDGVATHSYVFPVHLTSYYDSHRLLVGTQGFANLDLIKPDFVVPNGFLPLPGGSISLTDHDTVSYATLPTDGFHAIDSELTSRPINGGPATAITLATASNFDWRTYGFASKPSNDLAGGRWVTIGSLHQARAFHTATLLRNGKVLVVGGQGGGSPPHDLDTAELFDPATGTWSATGSLNAAKSGHSATLLPTGKVLVVGQAASATATAELYDPATGTWSLIGASSGGWRDHTATLLNTGEVLLAGGWGGATGYSSYFRAVLYDPATGSWSDTGKLNIPRGAGHRATLLQDGKVLVTGGSSDADFYTTLHGAESYDPTTGTWTRVAPLHIPRAFEAATLLTDGRVLLAGGNVAELYDPGTGQWSVAEPLTLAGGGANTASLLPDGTVLIAGGYRMDSNGDAVAVNGSELYDPSSGSWRRTASLKSARFGHTATVLANGNVLVAGGQRSLGGDASALPVNTEIFELTATLGAGFTGSWFNPAQNGHGFAIEVIPGQPPQLLASWFTFAPQGGQSWIVGLGPIAGNRAVLHGFQTVGPGGRFPPNFDPANVREEDWGTLTFAFSDCNHGHVDWSSSVPGYGSGGMDLTRLTLPAGLTCSP